MKILAFFLIYFGATVFADGQELNGIVKTYDGKPLENVLVYPNPVSTGNDGKFVLKYFKSKYLIFVKHGFKPLIRKYDNEASVEVILEREENPDSFVLPECSKNLKGKLIGAYLRMTVPKGFKSKQVRDVDYLNYYIYPRKEQKDYLTGWVGSMAASPFPKEEWINTTEKVNIQPISYQKISIGWNYTGQTKDGNLWRYVRILDESVYYYVDSDEKKTVFDQIIDSSCTVKEYL